MGYVTELELELAKECINAGKIEVNTEEEDYEMKTLQALYGLYWLGYVRDNFHTLEG